MPSQKSYTLELFVPTQCVCTEMIDEDLRNEVFGDAKTKFAKWFGGVSVTPIEGGWILPDGTLAEEKIDVVKSYASSDKFDDYFDDVKKLAETVANILTQDAVLLAVNSSPYFINRTDKSKKCSHEGLIPVVKVKEKPIHKYQAVYAALASFERLIDAKNLFCGLLNYNYADSPLPQLNWPEKIRNSYSLPPQIIADSNGFKIVYIKLSSEGLRRNSERQIIQRIHQENPSFRGLFVVSDRDAKRWEFINVKQQANKSSNLTLRRMRVGVPAVRTATERILQVRIEDESLIDQKIQELHEKAFDVTELTKQFFREISNWYFWAKEQVNFPPGQERVEKDVLHATCVIRLITRLIFVWFLKEKRADGHPLIPEALFNKKTINDLLRDFDPVGRGTESHYYKAILQNLFFATLNQPMKNRRWRKEGKDEEKNVYRYQNFFKNPNQALQLFKDIPFLNGGLFECLEQDHFSDLADSSLIVPDYLFFSSQVEVDLNKTYDTKNKKYNASGIIEILSRYNFTVEENTPIEEEIALDPELLGKVFENLLASFNPETGENARKQTGSFYTPREIVNYMVDESLKAYLLQKLVGDQITYMPVSGNQSDMFGNKYNKGQLGLMEEHRSKQGEPTCRERLDKLFSYDDHDENIFSDGETERLIDALHTLKVIDPACGSGAFPMGILHKMTYVLAKLDPGNERWKARQLRSVVDPAMREHIERTFDANDMDFGRKLYLIQNCIYGVDIQPIAVQISKLRFFISLIVDQRIHKDQVNLGILPLPNMETKFVAANSLVGLEKPQQLMLEDPLVKKKECELEKVRKEYFNADTQASKQKCMLADERLRTEISELLKKDQWPKTTANKIAAWNPYDLTMSSDFFDPEWMFGVESGFDICIGNPPYGGNCSEAERKYFLEFYKSAKSIKGKQKGSLDTYALFIEKGMNCLNNNSNLHYIIPISITSSESMTGLQKIMEESCDVIKISSYAVRPQPVFDNAVVNTSILFLNKTNNKCNEILTTKLYRKSKNFDLANLMANISFVNSMKFKMLGRYPKVGTAIELSILSKLFSDKNTKLEKLITSSGSPIYYRTTGGRYFKVVTNYPTGSTQEKPVYIDKKYSNVVGAILSTNLFFWYYQIYSDNFHIKKYELDNFTLPVSGLTDDTINEIDKIYSGYLIDIEKNANIRITKKYANINSFKEYKIGKSKEFIDKIDDIVCPLYGFSVEEVDFIKNYEVDFRLSDED